MGKKNKAKFRGSLGDTLSRLATTVKADAPTLLIGNPKTPSGTVKNEGYVSPFAMAKEAKPKSRLSQFAGSLVPRSPMQAWKDRKAAKKLKKLAKQMASKGNHNMLQIRRSRLPFVIALLVVALGFGGYYMFRSVTLPQVQVTKVVDYKKWLSNTSGQAPKTYSSGKQGHRVVKSYKVTKDGRHVSKSHKHKSKYAKGKKHHGKAKLAKAKKHHGKAKLAKAKKKSKVHHASHKR